MKIKLIYILIPFILLSSCITDKKKEDVKNINPVITLQTIAAFKSAELIYGDEWKLIFRKFDDAQYILFYTDINKINSSKDRLIITSDNKLITNPEYVNLRFSINYDEETALDPVTGENAIVNRLITFERSPGDRFAAAGFDDDTKADDFILRLKENVKNDSVAEISEMISYPLNTVIKKKRVKIINAESFIKDYDIIFNSKVKKSILNQYAADVKAGPKGLSIGTGEVLINRVNGKIYITSINNQ